MTKNVKKFIVNFLKDIFDQKLQFTYPQASIKDVQDTEETFSPQKRTSSTSTFLHFCGSFLLLSWIRTQPTKVVNADPDLKHRKKGRQSNRVQRRMEVVCRNKKQCWGSGSGTGSAYFWAPPIRISGSRSISQRYESGSGPFPFLIKVLSGLR
jgi:hypothetical protein